MIRQTQQVIKKQAARYYAPTKKQYRKIGDTIMLAGMGLQTSVMGLPICDNQKLWAVFFISIIALAGKLVTNFFKEETPATDELQNGQS